MIEVSLSSNELIVGQTNTINLTMKNVSDSACWDLLFEINLPPEGMSIISRKRFKKEYFPKNGIFDHVIKILVNEPGIYVLTSRRFEYKDSERNFINRNWLTELKVVVESAGSKDLEARESKDQIIEKIWKTQPEKQVVNSHMHIYNNMMESFKISELELICFEMSIDFEVLSGDNKKLKVKELIEYCRRRDMVNELVMICQKKRPHLDW